MIIVSADKTDDVSFDTIIKKWLTILYVYPKDDTPGCTTQAVDFSSLYDKCIALWVTLYGVSKDDASSHTAFIQKHTLTVPLIVDTDQVLIGSDVLPWSYGERNLYGKMVTGVIRSTYIYHNGELIKQRNNIRAKGHAQKVLDYVQDFVQKR